MGVPDLAEKNWGSIPMLQHAITSDLQNKKPSYCYGKPTVLPTSETQPPISSHEEKAICHR